MDLKLKSESAGNIKLNNWEYILKAGLDGNGLGIVS
jgi:hypothetical protein